MPAGGGVIGMCACPGGRRYLGGSGARHITLEEDLKEVAEFSPKGVVTLLEANEMEALGLSGLPSRLSGLGIEWRHLPIPDMEPPGPDFETLWITHGALLRYQLQNGDRILLHCFAGLGRTGTIAARLLVELGLSPAAAVRAVRNVRSGAIQTPDQAAYVYACTSLR